MTITTDTLENEDVIVEDDAEAAKIAEEAAAADKAKAEPTEVEKIAMEAGWKPESEWKGDKSGWTDAGSYIKNLAKTVKNRGAELTRREKDFDQRVKRLEKTMQDARRRDREELEADFGARIRKAIKDGDEDLEAALRKEFGEQVAELEELAEQELTPEQIRQAEDDYVEEFEVAVPRIQEPFWNKYAFLLDEDTPVDDFAMVEAEISKGMANGKTATEAFDAAEKLIARAFPDMIEEDEAEDVKDDPKPSTKRRAPPVIAPAHRATSASQATRLPAEARATAKRYIEEGLYGSYEEYAEVYFAEGGEEA